MVDLPRHFYMKNRSSTQRLKPSHFGLTENQKESHSRILQATRELVIEHGYEGTTMRTVAQKANVSATTLYNRYNTKDELVIAALQETIGDSLDADKPRDRKYSYELLLERLRDSVRQTEANPEFVLALSQAMYQGSGNPGTEPLLLNIAINEIATSLEVMVTKGEIGPHINLRDIATLMGGCYWSVFFLWEKSIITTEEIENLVLIGWVSILLGASKGKAKEALRKQHQAIISSQET